MMYKHTNKAKNTGRQSMISCKDYVPYNNSQSLPRNPSRKGRTYPPWYSINVFFYCYYYNYNQLCHLHDVLTVFTLKLLYYLQNSISTTYNTVLSNEILPRASFKTVLIHFFKNAVSALRQIRWQYYCNNYY